MQIKYDTGQTIYVPVTIDAAKTYNGEVYYVLLETAEEIADRLVPEYGIVKYGERAVFDKEVAEKYIREVFHAKS